MKFVAKANLSLRVISNRLKSLFHILHPCHFFPSQLDLVDCNQWTHRPLSNTLGFRLKEALVYVERGPRLCWKRPSSMLKEAWVELKRVEFDAFPWEGEEGTIYTWMMITGGHMEYSLNSLYFIFATFHVQNLAIHSWPVWQSHDDLCYVGAVLMDRPTCWNNGVTCSLFNRALVVTPGIARENLWEYHFEGRL